MRQYGIQFKAGNALALPIDTADRLIAEKNADAALVFVYLLRRGGALEPGQAALDTGLGQTRLEAALEALLRSGAVTCADEPGAPEGTAPPNGLPDVQYTPRELAEGLGRDLSFRWVCAEAEKALGRVLRQFEAETFFYIYDYLKLPPEVIVILIRHLSGTGAAVTAATGAGSGQSFGEAAPGGNFSFRRLRSEAALWAERGIRTAEEAEALVEARRERESAFGAVWNALGVRGRGPAASERRTIEGWLDQGFSPALIAYAYDITVTNKGALVWPYLRSILERWQKAGYGSPAEVDAGDRRGPRQDKKRSPAEEDAYYAELRRIYYDEKEKA